MISKYKAIGWTFFIAGLAGDLVFGGVRGDINFYGCVIIGSAFILSEWIIEDLRK